jgi:hypothetical protein
MFGHDQFNWTKIQNFKAEGDYSWKQTGNKDSKVTAEDPDCYTIFKSNAEVIGPDGEPIKVSETGQSDAGIIPCWADIPEGSKIKWMAKTLADDKQPAPDRVQVTLTWMDSVFAAKVVNEVIEELSEAEQDMLLTNLTEMTKIITERTMEKLTPQIDVLMKTIYSTVVETNESGYYEGEIPIEYQWPKGSYSLIIHNGYHAQSESSDKDKMIQFWFYEMGTLFIEAIVVFILCLIFPPACAVIAWVAFGAFILIDIAIMNHMMAKDAFGITGLNQYDCAFPDGGWNHSYAIGYGIEEADEEMASQVSPTSFNIGKRQAELYIEQNGVLGAIAVGTMVIAVTLILISRIKQKTRRKKDGS